MTMKDRLRERAARFSIIENHLHRGGDGLPKRTKLETRDVKTITRKLRLFTDGADGAQVLLGVLADVGVVRVDADAGGEVMRLDLG